MRQRIARTAAALVVALSGLGGLAAMLTTAPAASAAVAHPAASCGDIGITYGWTGASGMLMIVKNEPGGPLSFMTGAVNFTVQCAPLNGSITLELEKKFRTGLTTYWAQQGDSVSRNLTPPLPRGFSLTVPQTLCIGRSTWRMLMTWKGTAADGTYQEGSAYIPSSGGTVFVCLS